MVRYCLTAINQVFSIQIPRNVRFAEDHGPATVVGGKLSLLPLILIHSFLPQHRSPLCVHYSHLYDFVVNCIGEQICSKKSPFLLLQNQLVQFLSTAAQALTWYRGRDGE